MCVHVAHRSPGTPRVRAPAPNRNSIRGVVGFHASIETCFEVDAELIDRTLAPAASALAVSPRDRVLALLERMTDVARPRQGAARMLLVLARLAECDWVKGGLVIELAARGERTRLTASLEDANATKPMHAPFDVDAPIEEFVRVLERGGTDLAALEVAHANPQGNVVELRSPGSAAAHSRETVRAPGEPSAKRGPPPIPARGPRSTRADFHAKPTVRIPQVHLPPEAFRDDQERPPESSVHNLHAPDEPAKRPESAPPPTVRSTAGAATPMDDIDEGWD